MRRRIVTLTLVVLGFGLQVVSYAFLAAPVGRPSDVSFSEPRFGFAPTLFILGVMLVFLAAVAYELMPDGRGTDREEG